MAFAEEKNPAYDHIDAKKAMVSIAVSVRLNGSN